MRLYEMLENSNIEFDRTKLRDFEVKSLLPLEFASENDVSYIRDDKYLPLLRDCKAGAIFVNSKHKNNLDDIENNQNIIFTPNPHLSFAYLSQFFKVAQIQNTTSKNPHTDSKIFQNVFIGENVNIGNDCIIMPNVVICDDVTIGNNVKIYPNVTIYKGSIIGNNVSIHAGCVIGSDGFGYAHTNMGEHIKIEHFGNVIIEDDVEIGANTTIDRAVFSSTIIKKGVKIDNLVQIAHNCVIGEHSIMVSQCGIAGSSTVGRNVIFGGQSATAGHVTIGDFVQIAGRGAVSKNLPSNTKWGGHPIVEFHKWQKMQVKLRKLLKNLDLKNS